MVNAIDLAFVENPVDPPIQILCAGQIAAERFLDNDARKTSAAI
jgi:hypothetical protein